MPLVDTTNSAMGGALKREAPPEDAAHARLDNDLKVAARNVADWGLLDYEDADGRTYEERLESHGASAAHRNNLQARVKRRRAEYEDVGLSPEEIDKRVEDVDPYRYRSLELEAGEMVPLVLAEQVMPAFSNQLTFFDENGVKCGETVERIDVEDD